MKNIFLCISISLYSLTASAQFNGEIDPTFATDGTYMRDFGNVDVINGLRVQPDGKIVGAGVAINANYQGEMKVVRLTADGLPDNTFSDDGIADIPLNLESYGYDCYIKTNGQILVAGLSSVTPGTFAMAVVQLNADGTLDTAFGTNGASIINMSPSDDLANAMTVQADGKILLAGTIVDANYNYVPSVVRLTEEGDLDTSFSTDGIAQYAVNTVDNEFNAIAVQSDGKIIAAGHYGYDFSDFDFLVVRFLEDGSIDNSFGDNGAIIMPVGINATDDCFGIAMNSNDSFYLTGYMTTPQFDWNMVIIKMNANGDLDANFGTDGMVISDNATSDLGYDIVVAPNGNLIVGGTAGSFPDNAFALWCFQSNGTPETSFGPGGLALTNIGAEADELNAIAIQNENFVIAAGKSRQTDTNLDFAVSRFGYQIFSVNETSFAPTVIVSPNPAIAGNQLKVQLNNGTSHIASYSILDLQGKTICSRNSSFIQQNALLKLPIEITTGVYLLQITTDDHRVYQTKLVVE